MYQGFYDNSLICETKIIISVTSYESNNKYILVSAFLIYYHLRHATKHTKLCFLTFTDTASGKTYFSTSHGNVLVMLTTKPFKSIVLNQHMGN